MCTMTELLYIWLRCSDKKNLWNSFSPTHGSPVRFINAKDRFGYTPMHLAVREQRERMVRLLLRLASLLVLANVVVVHDKAPSWKGSDLSYWFLKSLTPSCVRVQAQMGVLDGFKTQLHALVILLLLLFHRMMFFSAMTTKDTGCHGEW